MKKKGILIMVAVLALCGATAWYVGFHKTEKKITLETEKPVIGYISKSVTATGTIEPVDTVTVGSQVSGTIKQIYVDFNTVVRKGQLIAELDKSLLQAQVNQYQANLEMSKANLVYQKEFFDRQNLLFQTGAISKQDYETALYQYNSAKANVPSVQAQLDAAKKNLSYCDIYSPIDGVVLTRNISIGQTVAASFNTPTLFIIAKDIANMQVQAAVDEADIGGVRPGQRVTFTVDAYPDNTFYGTVNQIRLEPQVSANVVTYTTIIHAPNDSLKLKPGMTANIFIYTVEEPQALLISVQALKFKPEKGLYSQYKIVEGISPVTSAAKYTDSSAKKRIGRATPTRLGMTDSNGVTFQQATVWVKSGDSIIKRVILTGISDDTHVQVAAGLGPDDEVILSESGTGIKAGATAPARSPFMPTRRPAAKPGTKTKTGS